MTEPQATAKPRKRPTQARSRATVEAILEATTRILRQSGPEAVTTNRVAEVAGVSVGSLYQYYPSREAVLAELVRRMRLSMSERLIETSLSARHLPLEEAIPQMMAAAIHQYETEPELTAALEAVEGRLPRDPDVMAGRKRVRDAMISCLSGRGIEDPGEAAMDLVAMIRGIVTMSLGAGRRDFDSIRRRIERAALGYLNECRKAGLG